ncbi:MAG: WD40 repeat protein [Planctomycetota bacterium]
MIFDSASGQVLVELEGNMHEWMVDSLAWSPDGTRVLGNLFRRGDDAVDPVMMVWDAEHGDPLLLLEHAEESTLGVAWSSDGTQLLSIGKFGSRAWFAATGEIAPTIAREESHVGSVAWSPDGTRIASYPSFGVPHLRDAVDGRVLGVLKIDGHHGGTLAWSPNGTQLVSSSKDNTLTIWDVETGSCLRVLEGHADFVNAIAWSPDGLHIASSSVDGDLCIWEATTGETWRIFKVVGGQCVSLAWNPDGKRIAAGVSGLPGEALQIWDAASGVILSSEWVQAVSSSHSASDWFFTPISWSPDGRYIAAALFGESLRILDASTGETLQTLRGHRKTVWSTSWSPDGKRIVSGSLDGTARVWDASNGWCLLVLKASEEERAPTVAWSPDGTRILSSGGRDNSIRIWESRVEDVLPHWIEREEDAKTLRPKVRPIVEALFDQHVLPERVMDELLADPSLPRELLDTAKHMVALRGGYRTSVSAQVESLNIRAWHLVDPDREDRDTGVALGLRLARAGVELQPEDSGIRDTFAWALFANDLCDEALAESERALELAPEYYKEDYQGHFDRLRTEIAALRVPAIDKTEDD